MLNGGYPEGRAVLVTGTPGTGKSTLAMQFLQAGLDEGDVCPFISTEQTVDELRGAFDSFAFDLDHDNLAITSLHARNGRTIESEDDEVVIERFDEGDVKGFGYSAEFSSERIQQVLEVIPRVSTSPERVDELIQRAEIDFTDTPELMDANRFLVIDSLGGWGSHENVCNPRLEDAGLQYSMKEIRNKSDGDGLFLLLNTEATVHATGRDPTRRLRYRMPSQLLTDQDVLLDVHTPNVMEERMAVFSTSFQ